jgi:Zn-dependent peptidase ImmA (M78 family)
MTDLENHVTYIRGFAVVHPFNDTVEAQPEHTIAHELGHILLSTSNEGKAERKAQELLSGQMVAKAPLSPHPCRLGA